MKSCYTKCFVVFLFLLLLPFMFLFFPTFFIILLCLKNICWIFLLGWKCCSNILQFNCGICSPFFTFTCAHVLWPSFCFLDSLGKWRNLIQSICLSHFRASFLPWPHVHSFISNVCVGFLQLSIHTFITWWMTSSSAAAKSETTISRRTDVLLLLLLLLYNLSNKWW